jgi:hypothetical protein
VIFAYECLCSATFQAELSVDDRYKVHCPECNGTGERPNQVFPGDPDGTLTIILQPVRWSMTHVPGIITEAECVALHGPDWRETPGSIRKFYDEPEKFYSGTHKGPMRRKGKSFLNHSPATDSPQVQAKREAKMVKDKRGR